MPKHEGHMGALSLAHHNARVRDLSSEGFAAEGSELQGHASHVQSVIQLAKEGKALSCSSGARETHTN